MSQHIVSHQGDAIGHGWRGTPSLGQLRKKNEGKPSHEDPIFDGESPQGDGWRRDWPSIRRRAKLRQGLQALRKERLSIF